MEKLKSKLFDPEFVNSKDAHGNTALHLAMVDKQVETTEYLVSMGAEAVEVNAQNQDDNTKKKKNSSDWNIRRASDWIMVVVVLLARLIFQNATTPPGGVWQEDNFLMDSKGNYVDPQGRNMSYPVDSQNNTVLYPHRAGYSVLARNDPTAYWTLCISNTVGFRTSLLVISLLMSRGQRKKLLVVCFYVVSFFAFTSVSLRILANFVDSLFHHYCYLSSVDLCCP